MAYETQWYLENRIILTTLSGSISIEDVIHNDGMIHEMVQAGTDKVHLMIDVRDLDGFPTNLMQINSSANRYLGLDHMGSVIVIGLENRMVDFLSSLITKLTSVNLFKAEDVDAGFYKLQNIDPSLIADTA